MIILLTGKSGSGKTTLAKALERKGFKRIVTYTTRPMREGEVDGVDYHFVSQKEFDTMVRKGEMAEYTSYNASFGYCSYGSTIDSYLTKEDSVIILNPYGLKNINSKCLLNDKIVSLYLNVDEDLLKRRLIYRGDSEEEISRRLEADNKDFENIINEVDYTIGVYDYVDEIIELAHTLYDRKNEDVKSAQEAFDELVKHFLGEDYYIVDPLINTQANYYILREIKSRYPKGKIRRIPKK